jgi:AraC-like DNA-binding protein
MKPPLRIYVHEPLSADRPVLAGRWTVDNPLAPAQHVHDSLELLWNESPLILNIGGQRFIMAEPQVVIVPALVPHIAERLTDAGTQTVTGSHLAVLEGALQSAVDQPTLKCARLSEEHNKIILPLVKHLHRKLIKSTGRVAADQRLMLQGILALLRELGYGSSEKRVQSLNPVQRALEVLYARYRDSELCIKDLADAADLSVAQFRRVFKQALGESPLAYLARHRLEQARLLLAQDRLTVEAVAHRVGFNSPGSFYARFTAAYGHSPRNKSRGAALREVARTWAPPNTYRRKKNISE